MVNKIEVPKILTDAPDINTDFRNLLSSVGLNIADTGGQVEFTGQDPILPSKHRLGAIMAMGMMGAAVATQIFYRMRGGEAQDLSVDLRDAVAHINPLYLFKPQVSGSDYNLLFADPRINPISFGMFPTKDNRWYLPTAAYPLDIPKWMSLLEAKLNKQSISNGILKWNAIDLENAAADEGLIGSMIRTPEEWYSHEQGSILANTPMIEIVKIGESNPELPKLTNPLRPLSGTKVAAFTHVIAGPVTARTLAEHGAEVLHFASPEFEYDSLVQDTHLGFRSAWMDLRKKENETLIKDILKDADVMIENYRGRSMYKYGLSPSEVAQIRPGIIYASLRAFGWEGPWSGRGGFDMDANVCSGFAVNEGTYDNPRLPTTVILNDYLAGYLLSMGVITALIMRAKFGGSYHVRCSLTRFSMWYSQLGLFPANYVSKMIKLDEHKPFPPKNMMLTGAFGHQVRLAPGIHFSKTPGHWEVPGHPTVVPRGSCEPRWLGY